MAPLYICITLEDWEYFLSHDFTWDEVQTTHPTLQYLFYCLVSFSKIGRCGARAPASISLMQIPSSTVPGYLLPCNLVRKFYCNLRNVSPQHIYQTHSDKKFCFKKPMYLWIALCMSQSLDTLDKFAYTAFHSSKACTHLQAFRFASHGISQKVCWQQAARSAVGRLCCIILCLMDGTFFW